MDLVLAGCATGGHQRFTVTVSLDVGASVSTFGRMTASESTRQGRAASPGFLTGARAVFSGFGIIARDPGLRKLVVIPIALTGLLYLALLGATLVFTDDALGLLWARPDTWWLLPVWYLAWLVGILTLFLIAALLFNTVAEAVGGPFYERMAMTILGRYEVPTEQPTILDGTILDIVRSLLFVVPAAILAVIGLMPAIGLPFTIAGATLAWLGFGATAVNPALLVTGHRFGARLSYVRKHFFTVLGFGGVVAFSLTVPFLPLLAIPCSIAGAADLYGRGILSQNRTNR